MTPTARWDAVTGVLDNPEISAIQKLVLIGIIRHANERLEESQPGNARLMLYASVSKEETIAKAVKGLKAAGLVSNRHDVGHARVFRTSLEKLITEAVLDRRTKLTPPLQTGGPLPPSNGGTPLQTGGPLPPSNGGTPPPAPEGEVTITPPPRPGGTSPRAEGGPPPVSGGVSSSSLKRSEEQAGKEAPATLFMPDEIETKIVETKTSVKWICPKSGTAQVLKWYFIENHVAGDEPDKALVRRWAVDEIASLVAQGFDGTLVGLLRAAYGKRFRAWKSKRALDQARPAIPTCEVLPLQPVAWED